MVNFAATKLLLIAIFLCGITHTAHAQCSESFDTDLYRHQKVGQPYKFMGKRYKPKHNPKYDEIGVASWYGPKFHGKPTATGEIFDKDALTAAHKTLPLNSLLCVTNLSNGKQLVVRLNDRGPFVGNRIIDLSQGAALALNIDGIAKVRIQYVGPADPMASKRNAPAPVQVPPSVPIPSAIPMPYPGR